MPTKKKIAWAVLVVLVAIQFIRPATNSSNKTENDISKLYPVPADVHDILEKSCFDCHSNYTVYPWYYNIQPVAWWLTNHINHGKRSLNFSEFATYRPYRQYDKLQQLAKLVNEGDMPLHSYTLIHRYAILDSTQRNTLNDWSKSLQHTMETAYPADSLVNPKKRKK